MTTRVDVDEIEATASEKLLAAVLAGFLLIGSVWFYVRVDDWTRDVVRTPDPSTAQAAAFKQSERAAQDAAQASERLSAARIDLETTREAYRTELDAGRPAVETEAAYRESQTRVKEATVADHSAQMKVKATERAARPAYRAYGKITHRAEVRQAWISAILRLLFVAGWFALSLRLISSLRRKHSRFLPLGFAAVGAGVITALIYATDYITDYIDPLDLGPIVLSALGAAATIGAFIGLQRWLADRLPGRRVRNGECPFCGFPVREGKHCEGCGREVVASCAACSVPRRVGSPHCSACGAA